MTTVKPAIGTEGSEGRPGEGRVARGVERHGVGPTVSGASSSRTRTMAGETVEFQTADYRAPEGVPGVGSGNAGGTVSPAADARLGRAAGVEPLRGRSGRAVDGATVDAEAAPKRAWIVVAALAAAALIVFACVYGIVRGALLSLDGSADDSASVAYATDAYVLFVVDDGQGGLDGAYLCYADTINERFGACVLLPSTYYGEDGSETESHTLAKAYGREGAKGVVRAVESLCGVVCRAYALVDGDQMNAVLGMAMLYEAPQTPSQATSSIWYAEQGISRSALYGLLRAMSQIGPENSVLVNLPANALYVGDEAIVLDHESVLSLVRGMRDPSGLSEA